MPNPAFVPMLTFCRTHKIEKCIWFCSTSQYLVKVIYIKYWYSGLFQVTNSSFNSSKWNDMITSLFNNKYLLC